MLGSEIGEGNSLFFSVLLIDARMRNGSQSERKEGIDPSLSPTG